MNFCRILFIFTLIVSTSLASGTQLCTEKIKFFASVFEYECEQFTAATCFPYSVKLKDSIDLEKFSAEFEADVKSQNEHVSKCLLRDANILFTSDVSTFLHCEAGYGRVKVTAKFECEKF